MELYLGLGSNLGDREANIRKALELLDACLPGRMVAVSPFLENPSDGFEGPDFLNAVALWDICLPGPCRSGDNEEEMCDFALRLLASCKGVEQKMGRFSKPLYDDGGKRIYSSRIIDVDVLMLGGFSMDTAELTLPHPRMFERDFVTIPLATLPGGKDILLKMK